MAFHALFSDTLGEGAELLVDEQATRMAIEEHFERLASCAEDDVVVVAFSGHGSETHELVTHDADPTNLKDTCVPLDTLTEWFARIPARLHPGLLLLRRDGGKGAQSGVGSP